MQASSGSGWKRSAAWPSRSYRQDCAVQKEERVRDPSLALSLSRSGNRIRGRRNLGLKSIRDLNASPSEPRYPERLYGVLRIPCAQPAHDSHWHCLCHLGRSRHRLDRLGWMVLVPADAGRSGTDRACPDRWRRRPCERLLPIAPALSRSQLSIGFSNKTEHCCRRLNTNPLEKASVRRLHDLVPRHPIPWPVSLARPRPQPLLGGAKMKPRSPHTPGLLHVKPGDFGKGRRRPISWADDLFYRWS